MNRKQFFSLFFCLFYSMNCDFVNKFDPSEINEPCNNNGIYKLASDCDQKNLKSVGFLISYGSVVCCPKIISRTVGDAAKEYCDANGVKEKPTIEDKIINGVPAAVGEFPHSIALYSSNLGELRYLCGGSLISEKFILTAAHCVSKNYEFLVRLGRTSLDLTNQEDSGRAVDIKVKKVNVPKEYTVRKRYNDIAVLELESPVTFTDIIKPICLHTESSSDSIRDLQIIGFGQLEANSADTSTWLMKAKVREDGLEQCNEIYRNNTSQDYLRQIKVAEGFLPTQICARGAAIFNNGLSTDTCEGDSGGSLFYANSKDKFKLSLVGVTSFGPACGSKSFPSIYTRVSEYVEWIEKIVWP